MNCYYVSNFQKKLRIFYKNVSALNGVYFLLIFMSIVLSFSSFNIDLDLLSFFKHRLELSNREAGTLFGLQGITPIVVGVPCGILIDKIGLKPAMIIGLLTGIFFGVYVAVSDNVLLIEMVINYGLSFSAVMVSVPIRMSFGRIVDAGVRYVAFNLLYWGCNVGDLIAAYTNPVLISNTTFGQYGIVFLVSSACCFFLFVVTFIGYTEPPLVVEILDYSKKPILVYERNGSSSSISDSASENDQLEVKHKTEIQKPFLRSLCDVLLDRSLWRCLCLSFIFIWLRMFSRFLTSILPMYMQNIYGMDVDYSFAIGINPAILSFTVLITTILLTGNEKNVSMFILIGSFIYAIAPLPMILLRGDSIEYPVWMTILLMTIGENIYSPVLDMIAVSIAPNDRKGLYMVIAGIPNVFGTLFSGAEAGYLLDTFCPSPIGTDYNHWDTFSCENLWVVVMLFSLLTPILWLVFRPFIYSKEKGIIFS